MAVPAWVPMAMMAAGALVSMAGSISQGNAAKKAAEANANLAEREASYSRKEASAEADRIRRDNRRLQGSAATQLNASGLSPNLALLEDIAMEGELDALIAQYRGERSAQNLEARADIDRFEGRQARRAGYFEAGSTLLTSGSRFLGTMSRSPRGGK